MSIEMFTYTTASYKYFWFSIYVKNPIYGPSSRAYYLLLNGPLRVIGFGPCGHHHGQTLWCCFAGSEHDSSEQDLQTKHTRDDSWPHRKPPLWVWEKNYPLMSCSLYFPHIYFFSFQVIWRCLSYIKCDFKFVGIWGKQKIMPSSWKCNSRAEKKVGEGWKDQNRNR